MLRLGVVLLNLALLAACVSSPPVPQDALADLAPTGKLRAGIFVGNLAGRDPTSGEARGVAVDLARDLGRRIGVPVEFVIYDRSGQLADAVKSGAWDIGFLTADPARSLITFTPAYVEIEATYLVPKDSQLRSIADVDRKGVRVAVSAKTGYDLFLSRNLQRAQLVRVQGTTTDAFKIFVADGLEAVAGLRLSLVQLSKKLPGSRVLDGRFTVTQHAIGIPRGRNAGATYLRAFVEEAKASGFVSRAIEKHGVRDASVASSAPVQ